MTMAAAIRVARTPTTTLASGNNTIVAASAIAADEEMYLQVFYAERVDTTDVTLIMKNTADTPVEVMPRITLNSDKGAVWLEFPQLSDDKRTLFRCGAGEGLVINSDQNNKARVWLQYVVSNSQGAL